MHKQFIAFVQRLVARFFPSRRRAAVASAPPGAAPRVAIPPPPPGAAPRVAIPPPPLLPRAAATATTFSAKLAGGPLPTLTVRVGGGASGAPAWTLDAALVPGSALAGGPRGVALAVSRVASGKSDRVEMLVGAGANPSAHVRAVSVTRT